MRDGVICVTKDVVDIYEFGMTRVSHTMVADEDDINYVRQVTGFKCGIEVSCKSVDLTKNFLRSKSPSKHSYSGALVAPSEKYTR